MTLKQRTRQKKKNDKSVEKPEERSAGIYKEKGKFLHGKDKSSSVWNFIFACGLISVVSLSLLRYLHAGTFDEYESRNVSLENDTRLWGTYRT